MNLGLSKTFHDLTNGYLSLYYMIPLFDMFYALIETKLCNINTLIYFRKDAPGMGGGLGDDSMSFNKSSLLDLTSSLVVL